MEVDGSRVHPMIENEAAYEVALLSSEDCTAHSSRTGLPCQRKAVAGSNVCASHGGSAPQVRNKAVRRMALARDLAIDRLIERLEPPDSPLYAVEVKDLVAVIDKLSSKIQLLTGEATERKEETKKEEVRHRLELQLDALGSRLQRGIDADIIDVEAIEEG